MKSIYSCKPISEVGAEQVCFKMTRLLCIDLILTQMTDAFGCPCVKDASVGLAQSWLGQEDARVRRVSAHCRCHFILITTT